MRKQKVEQEPVSNVVSTADAEDSVSDMTSRSEELQDRPTEAIELSTQLRPPKEDSKPLERAGAVITNAADGTIRGIDFKEVEVNDDLIAAVTKLKSPTRLAIHATSLTPSGWEQIASLRSLEHLDLRGSKLDNSSLKMLLAGLPNLVALRLNGQSGATSVDDQAMPALASCPGLRVLALDHLWIGEEGLREVVKLKQLSELYMAGTVVDDQAVGMLSGLPKLRKLRLALTSITAEGLAAIENLPLVELDLSECSQVGDEAMQVVGNMTSLVKLNLFKTTVSDAGVAKLGKLKALEWLNLDQTQITDAALPTIGKLTSLTFLHLGSTAISDKGMPDLVSLKSLRQLIVTRTGVTQDGVVTLKNWLSGTEVQLKYVPGQ